jgi:hypothetical protein
MTVLQLPQGYYRPTAIDGQPLADLLTAFAAYDAEFYAKHPSATPQRWYHVLEVPDHASCPWGREWYRVLPDRRVEFYQAQYDSSG